MSEAGKVGTLVESVAQIADAFDRLVALAEDWSDALGLPEGDRGHTSKGAAD